MSDEPPTTRTGRVLRAAARWAALGAAAACAWTLVPVEGASLLPAAASPYVAACSALAARAAGLVTCLALPVLLISLVRRRWFCRWACPTGLVLDRLGRLRRAGHAAPRCPALGRWLVVAGLAAAALGQPLLLWLDPLAMFQGLFAWFRWPLTVTALAAGAALPALALASTLLPGLWCARLCPLGATQDLLAWPGALLARLKAHGRSRADRPAPALPAAAGMARRALLAAGAGLAWGAARRAWGAGSPRPLRPPGALAEAQLADLCIRCGNCARACPTGIISPDLGEGGLAGLLAPAVSFEHSHCLPDCVRCGRICPSGAIRPLSPKAKQHARIGLARVDMSACLVGNDQECSLCADRCPYGAIRTAFDEAGYRATVLVDPARCNGCGACQVVCVTTPRPAIVVRAYPSDPHRSETEREARRRSPEGRPTDPACDPSRWH